MGRIARTWRLAKQSWAVLRADKELLTLPVISFAATLVVMASFLVPGFNAGLLNSGDPGAAGYILLFALYIALAYVTIFFNAALILAADERMRGGDPTVRSALSAASAHAGRMLPWALLSATVSVILQVIEEQGFIGDIVASVLGFAWSAITFLVIPVLVLEKVGVAEAVRRSMNLFKRTWGENIAAQIGFGLLGFVAAIPGMVLLFLALTASSAGTVVLLPVAVAWIAVTAVILAALNGVFQAALYYYATDGQVPGVAFDEHTLANSFGPRRRRRGIF